MKTFLSLFCLLLAVSTLYAQTETPATNSMPIESAVTSTNAAEATNAVSLFTEILIESDEAVMQSETNYIVVYTGNVRATYGDESQLTCEQLTIEAEKEAEAPHYILADRNVHLNHRTKGKVTHSTADRAKYFIRVENGITNELVMLTGNVNVINEKQQPSGETATNRHSGETVTLNLTTGEIRSSGRQQTGIAIRREEDNKLPFTTSRTNAP
jgi:lipopolysaccharide transport protein LptA